MPSEIEITAALSFVDSQGNITIPELDKPFFAPFPGRIYLAERFKNSDRVKRPSDGGKGWAMDTFNEEITTWYLHEFWERLNIGEGLLRAFFTILLSIREISRPISLKSRKRRGYEIVEFLHILAGTALIMELIGTVEIGLS